MGSQSVQVTIRLGHTAQLRKKPTIEGFTHDWKIFVRGPDGGNIQNFVEKVVFHLHDSFPKAKRVVKDPPYEVSESGYAGFLLPIDIYFKSKNEPRKIRFNYDLFLQLQDSPPVHHIRCEKLTFQNPAEEFRDRLMASGGVLAGSGSDYTKTESVSSKNLSSKPQKSSDSAVKSEPPKPTPPVVSKEFTDLFGSPLTKEDITTSKKTASKPAAFASSKEKKEKDREKSSSHSKSSGSKSGTLFNLNTPSPATPPTGKDKYSSSRDKEKDKYDKEKNKHNKDKDRSSNKRMVESPPSTEEFSSKKKKRMDSTDRSPPEVKYKEKEKSSKNVTVKSEKETKDSSSSKHSSHKHKSSKKDKSEGEVKEIKKEKDNSHDSKSKHSKHDKNDKERKHSKEKHYKKSPSSKTYKKDLVKSPAKSEKTSKSSEKSAKKPSPPSAILRPFEDDSSASELSDVDPFGDQKTTKGSPGSSIQSFNSPKTIGANSHGVLKDDSSDSDSDLLSPLEEKSPPNIFSQHTPKASPNKSPATQSDRSTPTSQSHTHKHSPSSQKGHSSSKSSKSKYKEKDFSATANKKAKLERKSSKEEKNIVPNFENNDSLKHRSNGINGLATTDKNDPVDHSDEETTGFDLYNEGESHLEVEHAPNGESLSVLVQLQQRLMMASDNSLLRRVVHLIEETGQFKIDDNTFNFDLCNLDRITVQKLQTCLLTT